MNLEINKILDFLKNNKFKDAILNLDELIKNDQNNVNYYHLRGISYLKLAKFDFAKNDFDKLLKLKSDFPDVYNNLGVLYFSNGENELAIKNFHKAIELRENFDLAINGLIKALCYKNSVENYDSFIFKNHNEINKIKFEYDPNDFIDDDKVFNFLDKTLEKIDKKFQNLNYHPTQIYRRDKRLLNCKRHDKVFKTHKVIPEFCFGCYKVQIEPKNFLDLIKLYILFDNIYLENIRKCMIELRPNIPGNYKGFIYCNSIEEAKDIQNKISYYIKNNLKKNLPLKIKRGCTEYGLEYSQYNNLEKDVMTYKSDWKKYENSIDESYPHLAFNDRLRPTIKGATLHDILVIRNWIYFAKLNGDEKIEMINNQIFESSIIKKKFNLKSS